MFCKNFEQLCRGNQLHFVLYYKNRRKNKNVLINILRFIDRDLHLESDRLHMRIMVKAVYLNIHIQGPVKVFVLN